MKYKYETHLHISPISKCARQELEETLQFYKNLGYDGVFITNHYIKGNINYDRNAPFEEITNYYFSDKEKAEEIGRKIGIKVFHGFEMGLYGGSEMLVYGIDKQFLLNHPQVATLSPNEAITLFRLNGAFVVQAHPFREAPWISNITLFPRSVDAIETLNNGNDDLHNELADHLANSFQMIKTAGSDNHNFRNLTKISGVEFDYPIESVDDFIKGIKENKHSIFTINLK